MTLINSSLTKNYNYQNTLSANSKKTEIKSDALEKISTKDNNISTETYNPIDNNLKPGMCRIPLGKAGKILGKLAFRAAGGWIGIGISTACTLYAHYGEGKGWGQSLKEGFLW